jgi:hypothetical protein
MAEALMVIPAAVSAIGGIKQMFESDDTRPNLGGPGSIQNDQAQRLNAAFGSGGSLPIQGRGRELLGMLNSGGVAGKMGLGPPRPPASPQAALQLPPRIG